MKRGPGAPSGQRVPAPGAVRPAREPLATSLLSFSSSGTFLCRSAPALFHASAVLPAKQAIAIGLRARTVASILLCRPSTGALVTSALTRLFQLGGSMLSKACVSKYVCLPLTVAACSLLLARPAAAQNARAGAS